MEEMKCPEPKVTDRNETPKTSAARKRPTFQGVLHLRGARLWGKRAQGQVPLIRKNDNIKE